MCVRVCDHFMLDVGVGSSCEWEKHQGELVSAAKRYMRERGWSGVFGVCCESVCVRVRVCVCVCLSLYVRCGCGQQL